MLWLSLGVQRFPLRQGETTIGRSPYCSVVVASSAASREHAAITVDGDRAHLTDVGSRNGTRLNGHVIARTTQLEAGDEIGIGGEVLTVIEGRRDDGSLASTTERGVATDPPPSPRVRGLDESEETQPPHAPSSER